MNVETVESFWKDASWAFFNEFGLINYQKNSFKFTVWLFRTFVVGSSFDRSSKSREVCHHHYEKVTLDKLSFWIEKNDHKEEFLNCCLGMLDFKIWPILLSWRYVHIYILKKSDKVKDWHFAFVFSLMFTSCIIMSPMYGWPDVDRLWGDYWRRKLFFGTFPNILDLKP